VLGCVVNGIGEGKEADIGIAGGEGVGILFKKGKLVRKVPIADLMECLIEEVDQMAKEKEAEGSSAVPAEHHANGSNGRSPQPSMALDHAPSTIREIPVLPNKR
jgi:(E)-4-hydroxy-3-methylbut-2-enyl-diphosphate synthase